MLSSFRKMFFVYEQILAKSLVAHYQFLFEITQLAVAFPVKSATLSIFYLIFYSFTTVTDEIPPYFLE